jgi:nucleoid-associated protein YgaU
MGLISFVKSAGRSLGLFGGREAAEAEAAKAAAVLAAAKADAEADAEAAIQLREQAMAADIRAAVLSYVDIQGLTVGVDGDQVAIGGTAQAQADAEKAVLVAGNTDGVAAVDNGLDIVVPEPPAVYHEVVAGDTLSKIAQKHYGVMRMYDLIFEANKPMLEHPDKIYPGQNLRIPPVAAAPVHVVQRGETLGGIAKHWFGDAKQYKAIFEANRGVLSSPDVVEVGQELRIPVA